jgi:hypothetical protein
MAALNSLSMIPGSRAKRISNAGLCTIFPYYIPIISPKAVLQAGTMQMRAGAHRVPKLIGCIDGQELIGCFAIVQVYRTTSTHYHSRCINRANTMFKDSFWEEKILQEKAVEATKQKKEKGKKRKPEEQNIINVVYYHNNHAIHMQYIW